MIIMPREQWKEACELLPPYPDREDVNSTLTEDIATAARHLYEFLTGPDWPIAAKLLARTSRGVDLAEEIIVEGYSQRVYSLTYFGLVSQTISNGRRFNSFGPSQYISPEMAVQKAVELRSLAPDGVVSYIHQTLDKLAARTIKHQGKLDDIWRDRS